MPEDQISVFLCDAVSHALESYVSIVPNRIAKEIAIMGMRLIKNNFPLDPQDDYRFEKLMLGAYWSGAAASHCSVGIAHAFSHTAARFSIGHAVGNALALPEAFKLLKQEDKLGDFCAASGFTSTNEFENWLNELTSLSAKQFDFSKLSEHLCSTSERTEFIEQMGQDVCMRTAPIRMNVEAISDFVDRIIRAAQ